MAANVFDKVAPVPAVGPHTSLDRLREESQALDGLYRALGELSHDHHERTALTSAVPGPPDPRWAAVAAALESDGDTGAAAALRAYADGKLMVADGDGAPVGLLTRIGQEAVLAAYRWPEWVPLLGGGGGRPGRGRCPRPGPHHR